MLKYRAGSGLEHTFVYPVPQCKRARQTPPLSEHSQKMPVYNVSPDRTTAVPSVDQNSSSLLSRTVFVLSVCTRLVNAVLANTLIFLLPPCVVFKPL